MSNQIHQIEVPPNNNTDQLLADYRMAEVTVLYSRNKDTSERMLIFGLVELLPQFIEAGPTLPEPICSNFKNSRIEINLHRFHLSSADAIAWYLSCRDGRATVPAPEGQQRADLPLSLGLVAEEPPWPNLVCDSGETLPLWGYHPGQSRVHQLMPVTDVSACFGRANETDKCRDWLITNFPLEIFDRSRLWGSAHLIAPNPVVRNLNLRLSEADSRLLCIHSDIYPGADINGIELFIRESRPRGIGLSMRVPLQGPYTAVKIPYDPHHYSYELVCKKRGVLLSVPSSAFLRSTSMSVGLSSRTRRVHVQARTKSREAEVYEVPMISGHDTIAEPPPVPSATGLVAEDLRDLASRDSSKSTLQQWFDGDTQKATQYIRRLINAGTKNVYIVDPYFGKIELHRFALANATNGVKIRILTSAEFLKMRQENATELDETLRSISQKTRTNDIEIRVGLGKRAPIHDRFLVIDDRAWILGSSLNEFGERGTVAIQAHYHQPLISILEETWNSEKCISLEAFLSQRSKSAG